MPRPKADLRQRLTAYRYFGKGMAPNLIWERLSQQFSEPVHKRTVERWMRVFKDSEDEATAALDTPFLWHSLEKYGLPWEAGDYLLEIWKIAKRQIQPSSPHEQILEPTFRQARWWWRVHLAVPTVGSPVDVYTIAEMFVFRELLSQALGEPLDLGDLQAVLAYRPWDGEQQWEAYVWDVKNGVILPLTHPFPFWEPEVWDRVKGADNEPLTQAGINTSLLPGFPRYLLTQVVELSREDPSNAHQKISETRDIILEMAHQPPN